MEPADHCPQLNTPAPLEVADEAMPTLYYTLPPLRFTYISESRAWMETPFSDPPVIPSAPVAAEEELT